MRDRVKFHLDPYKVKTVFISVTQSVIGLQF